MNTSTPSTAFLSLPHLLEFVQRAALDQALELLSTVVGIKEKLQVIKTISAFKLQRAPADPAAQRPGESEKLPAVHIAYPSRGAPPVAAPITLAVSAFNTRGEPTAPAACSPAPNSPAPRPAPISPSPVRPHSPAAHLASSAGAANHSSRQDANPEALETSDHPRLAISPHASPCSVVPTTFSLLSPQ